MKQVKRFLIVMILMFLGSSCFADFLYCKDLPFVPEGKVTSFMGDFYNFRTLKGNFLIGYQKDQCQVYKTYDELMKSLGWTKGNES